ncbi:hypothetical protein HY641_01885 [Candidatus Woesearchaeota archaeon]|nr:hypothetical protein [Candidatus Woesearchaeota archaeon]
MANASKTHTHQVSHKQLGELADDLHALKEWVAVYETEYGLPKEVVRTITSRIERVAKKLITL